MIKILFVFNNNAVYLKTIKKKFLFLLCDCKPDKLVDLMLVA